MKACHFIGGLATTAVPKVLSHSGSAAADQDTISKQLENTNPTVIKVICTVSMIALLSVFALKSKLYI